MKIVAAWICAVTLVTSPLAGAQGVPANAPSYRSIVLNPQLRFVSQTPKYSIAFDPVPTGKRLVTLASACVFDGNLNGVRSIVLTSGANPAPVYPATIGTSFGSLIATLPEAAIFRAGEAPRLDINFDPSVISSGGGIGGPRTISNCTLTGYLTADR